MTEKEKSTEEVNEKEPGKFKTFFNKTKQKASDAILEAKIEAHYRKDHNEFTIYQKDELLSKTVFGTFEGNGIVVFGEQEIKPNSVLIDEETEKAYYVVKTQESKVRVALEGFEYEREGTHIELDDKVTEVKVIKAGKRYFLYKE